MKKAVRQVKFSLSPLAWMMLSVLGGSVLLTMPRPAVAQTAPIQGGGSDIGVNQSGDMPDMFNLMHQLQRGEIRNPYQFQQDQQQNINTEAADFREQQRRALEQPPQPGTVEAFPAESAEPNEL
jgi:hypothetical protein